MWNKNSQKEQTLRFIEDFVLIFQLLDQEIPETTKGVG
jgi:hypothetical protein